MTRKTLFAALLALWVSANGYSWTKDGTVYTTDGSQADVQSAINDATNGDTVTLPAGTFSGYSTGGAYLNIHKPITLLGAGKENTRIQIANDGGAYANAAIRIYAAATISSMTIESPSTSNATPLLGGADGWRVTDTAIEMNGGGAYIIYAANYGVFDNNTTSGGWGSMEGAFGRGPTDSWKTPNSMGTEYAVYLENNTFGHTGYICDANSNARYVVRYNTISTASKIDGHGLYSNTPPRGVRQMEVYGNVWTYEPDGAWAAIEIRGGTARVFDNVMQNDGYLAAGSIQLREYGLNTSSGNFGTYMTPLNYPVGDQIGTGQDVIIAATALQQYRYARIETVGTTDFTTIGAANNNVGTAFIATGPGTGTGTVSYSPATEPVYMWNNRKGVAGASREYIYKTPPNSGAIDLYRTQTGDPEATFAQDDVIMPDRDYFNESIGAFDGSTGVGIGTKAEMLAITGTTTGVGFWVTDEAEWNSTNGALPDGQLYVWDGAAWQLDYTPYQYPHPATVAGDPPTAPSTLSASVAGYYSIDLTWSDLSADESGFKVERSTDGVSFSQVGVNAANDSTFTDSGLTPGTLYYYRVRSYNGAGDSGYSNTDSATTTALPPAPAQPTGLAASTQSVSEIGLSWTDNATNETSYRVEYSLSSGSGFSTLASGLAANSNSYNATSLSAGTTYYFRVLAVNAGGASTPSAQASATTALPSINVSVSPQNTAAAAW